MKKIAVVTGSQASLSDELVTKFSIQVIPYHINYPDRSLREVVDIKTEEFYETLSDINNLPSTSPPSIGEIKEVLAELAKEYDEIFLFTLSKKYSQMFQSCSEAKKELGHQSIKIIDSQGASAYQAMMVVITSLMIQNNKSIEEISQMIASFSENCDEYLVFDTLRYLEKGGRIGKVQALLGSMISIKPVVGHRDGESFPLFKVRSNKAGLTRIIKDFKNKIKNPDSPVAIIYQGIYNDDWLSIVKDELVNHFNVKFIWKSRFSTITSIHTGPKAWSICIYNLGSIL